MSERTLVLVKPDGVRRGLVGEVLGRIERKGFTLVAAELRTLEAATVRAHYAEHEGKPFFDGLVEFLTGGPTFCAVVAGPGVIGQWRQMMGATDPAKAAPGSIRGDFACAMPDNITHGSDSPESAAREIALFFPGLA
ncbi:MAG TPA: nucleoside-diphosphate kinase [Mycobacteriales bacterium]